MKTIVGVLRGGPSSEYEVSLKTGSSVLKNLPEKFRPVDIFISKDGEWHVNGMVKTPEKALKGVDVAFNAMHGEYGEDGKVQRFLESIGIPFTGSDSFSSALGMNKHHSKVVFKKNGLKTAKHILLTNEEYSHDNLFDIFRSFPQPSVIKPLSLGSSVGVTVAKSYSAFQDGVRTALEMSPKIMIEEFISGREATCGVVENFRGRKTYALLPIEIIKPKESAFFDYEAKYGGGSQEICPGNFSDGDKREIEHMAAVAHEAVGLRHYSRSDFIVSPNRGIYILEINSQPGLTSESLLPKSLKAIGCAFSDFLEHLISLALGRKK